MFPQKVDKKKKRKKGKSFPEKEQYTALQNTLHTTFYGSVRAHGTNKLRMVKEAVLRYAPTSPQRELLFQEVCKFCALSLLTLKRPY